MLDKVVSVRWEMHVFFFWSIICKPSAWIPGHKYPLIKGKNEWLEVLLWLQWPNYWGSWRLSWQSEFSASEFILGTSSLVVIYRSRISEPSSCCSLPSTSSSTALLTLGLLGQDSVFSSSRTIWKSYILKSGNFSRGKKNPGYFCIYLFFFLIGCVCLLCTLVL